LVSKYRSGRLVPSSSSRFSVLKRRAEVREVKSMSPKAWVIVSVPSSRRRVSWLSMTSLRIPALNGVQIVCRVRRKGRQTRCGGQGGDADRRAGVLIDLVMGPAEDHLRLGTDIPAQGCTRRPVVFAVIVLAGGLIDEPAVAAVHQGVHPQGQGVVDRQIDQTLEATLVIFAQPHAEAGFEFVAGLVGGDGHGAGGAVAAEQGALRPFQHLDPGHVAERQQAGARARRIDAVDIDAHRRVGADAEVRRRDPANAVLGLGRTGVRH